MTITPAEIHKRSIVQAVSDYGKRLFAFIRNRVASEEDAEDILQDVWYQFSRVMNTEPIEQVSGWLFHVARNKIVDQYRKRHTRTQQVVAGENESIPLQEILLAKDADAELAQMQELFWEELFEALEELPAEQRAVFTWNELDGISFQEISEKTGENVNTLISRKRYAVLHLRKRLEVLYKEIIEP